MFYKPMIKSQPFSWPMSLGCDFHTCFSAFFYPSQVSKESWRGLDLCNFPSPKADKALVKYFFPAKQAFVMENTLGTFQNCYFSPSPVGNQCFFLALPKENLVGFLQVKAIASKQFIPRLAIYQLPFLFSYQFTAPAASVPGKLILSVILCVLLSLQALR